MPAPARAALLAVLFAALLAACQTEEEAPPASPTPSPGSQATPTASPQPKGTLWRWVNVTVVVPQGSDLRVIRQFATSDIKPPDGGPVLEIVRYIELSGKITSSVIIDAESGNVLRDNVRDQDRPLFEEILKTLRVSPLDPLAAPWPHREELPNDLKRSAFSRISYALPPPDAGLQVYSGMADPGGAFISITNGRSTAFVRIDPTTGALITDVTNVLAADRAAFDRWLAEVKACGVETEC